MGSFKSDSNENIESFERESTATYLLARDEDCENSFHSSADFVRSLSSTGYMNCLLTSLIVIVMFVTSYPSDEYVFGT